MKPCGSSCPRAEGQGAKQEVCFAHKILVFFFSLLENVANFQMKQQLPTIPYHEFHN
jgi:hypothetical protein